MTATVYDFRSDNVGGAAPELLEALVAASAGTASPYGDDDYTRRMTARFCGLFECDLTALPVATGTGANCVALAALANALAVYVEATGQFASAKQLLEQALAARRSRLGPDHPLTIDTLSDLAVVLQDLEEWEASLTLSREAWHRRHALRGPDDASTLVMLNNYATALADHGDLAGELRSAGKRAG